MIKITIPNNNINEREYITDIIFDEFLGLEYKMEVSKKKLQTCEVELENGNKLIIEDHFFYKYHNDLEYLQTEHVPTTIGYQTKTDNYYILENDIPIIYGSNKLETINQKSRTITCGIDIFASSFFMLTRWEEYVNKNRDNHNRFPATESLAFKHNFLDRPLVNEYVAMLKNMLFELDDNVKFKTLNSQLFLTHDVDQLYMWKSWKQVVRVALGDILKRRDFTLAYERFVEYFLIKKHKILDPFDTYDWLMDKSESIGLKSRFYFMSGGSTSYDNRYEINEPKSLELLKKIKKRGHIIGIHPSYNAYNDIIQFRKELNLLEKTVNLKITEGREHYLRFEVPTTWQIWEDNGMEVDSTCGYADKEGFRCGTGNEYTVFNILSRKKLNLKERPLIVMDGTLFNYNDYSYTDAESNIKKCRKVSDTFTMLWHNNYIKHIKFYEKYIKNLQDTDKKV